MLEPSRSLTETDRRAEQRGRDNRVESSKITLPLFDEKKEDIESYLTTLERFAEELGWDEATWAWTRVGTLLNTKAITLIRDMDKGSAKKNDQLVEKELLRGFQCTSESYRETFRESKRNYSDETFSTFVNRIDQIPP